MHKINFKILLPTEWEKIFGSYTSDKELINQDIQRAQKSKLPKINYSMKKWAKGLKRAFLKKQVQLGKTYKEIFNFPGHKGNANQNHVNSPTLLLLEWLSSRRKTTTKW
jgi:hypothetical protein